MCGEWQPIETAPKDGRHVLVLAYDGCISVAHGRPTFAQARRAHWWHPSHVGGHDMDWDYAYDGSDFTHWMPLPKPPTSTS